MMNGLFWISYAAVWVLLLTLSGGLLIMFRSSVRAYRTHGPKDVGDVGTMNGPPLDARPPVLELEDLSGDPVSIGQPSGTAQLIVFAKNTCPKCKVALELLRAFAAEHTPLDAIVVCGGSRSALEECAALVRSPLRAVADLQWKGAKTWGIASFPFGVVVDGTGVVRGRGDPTSAAMLTIVSAHLERSREGTAVPM